MPSPKKTASKPSPQIEISEAYVERLMRVTRHELEKMVSDVVVDFRNAIRDEIWKVLEEVFYRAATSAKDKRKSRT